MDKFKIVAKTLAGLEEILAKEIEQLGGTNIAIGNRMVSYVGDKQLLYKSNLWLRTALRVLKPVEQFDACDPDELYAQIKAIDWGKYVAEGQTIAIDNTIFSENFRNSRYAIYRAKDAICDWFVEQGMKRPRVSVGSADVQLNLHITDTRELTVGVEDEAAEAETLTTVSHCTLSLDSSGDPLYKRGYKEYQTDAPISEVLAAGILMKAGYDGTRDLYDPMCGSGTFLIEAALIATNTPAGLYRKGFGFQRWTVGDMAFDEELWQDLYDDDSQEREFMHHIYGSDISKVAIEATAENVRAAGLNKYITLEVKDFEELKMSPWGEQQIRQAMEGGEATADGGEKQGGIVVMNPPYGKRLFTDVPTFYRMIGNQLKQKFQGSEAWVISSDDPNATFSTTDARGFRKEGTPFDFIGLKASIKIDLNNGGIPCQLRKYELFSGKYDEFRKEGGELDKESADQKQDNSKFERLRPVRGKRDFKRDGEKRDFKRGDRKEGDGAPKKRFYDKDGNAFERGHKRVGHDDKPNRTRTAGTERTYTVNKDGSISGKPAGDAKPFEKREGKPFEKRGDKPFEKRDRKPFDRKGGKPFDKEGDRKPFTPRGNFKRNAEGKLEEREGGFQPRGKREYDPNRPMFGKDFDMSKAVLDYTQPKDENK